MAFDLEANAALSAARMSVQEAAVCFRKGRIVQEVHRKANRAESMLKQEDWRAVEELPLYSSIYAAPSKEEQGCETYS